jgi:PAS domain S-box-containing protein
VRRTCSSGCVKPISKRCTRVYEIAQQPAIDREHQPATSVSTNIAQPSPRRRIQLLYVGDPTLARECFGRSGGSIEVTVATPRPDGRLNLAAVGVDVDEVRFDVLLVEHGTGGVDALAILQDVAARALHLPTVVVAEWNEALAADALRHGASDYVVRTRPSFRALYFRLHRLIAHGALLKSESARQRGDATERDELRTRLTQAEEERHLAERRLADAIGVVKQVRQERLADAVAAAREHAQRESDFAAQLAEATASAKALQQHALERLSRIETALHEEGVKRQSLEAQLAHTRDALRESDRAQHIDAAAFHDRLVKQKAEFTVTLADMTRARDLLERRMQETIDAANQALDDRAASAKAAAERTAAREAALLAQIAAAHDDRAQLERRLADAEAAVRSAEQRVVAAHQAGQQRIAERQAEFHAELTRQRGSAEGLRQRIAVLAGALKESEDRAAESRATLQAKLAEAEHALARATERYDADITDAAGAIAEIRDQAAARIADAAAALKLVEQQLAESEDARERDREAQAALLSKAADELADAREHAAAQVLQTDAAIALLHEKLTAGDSARELAAVRHKAEMADATARLAEHEQKTEMWLTEAAAVANDLQLRLVDVERQLDDARGATAAERESAMARSFEQQREFELRLSEARHAREAVAEALRESQSAFDAALEQHAAEMAAATQRLQEAEEKSSARLAQAANAIKVAESKKGEAIAALNRVVQQAAAERQAASAEAAERQAQFKETLAREAAHRHFVEHELAETRATAEEERRRFEQTLAATDQRARGQLAHVQAERDTLRDALDHTRAAADETLGRMIQDRAMERARLEAIIADLNVQLKDLGKRLEASEQAASQRLAEAERRLNDMTAVRDRATQSAEQLADQLQSVRRQLEAVTSESEILRATANRIPELEQQIEAIGSDSRRRFDASPASWCRCDRSGRVEEANRALGRLIGYDPAHLPQLDFGAAVFESAGDLRWLLDRSLASLSLQSIETTWKRHNGRRIIVRVVAVPASAESVDLVAEDITHLRELEEKLRNAQRMEAVARYGSEVAVTCQGLLTHVKEEGQQWLAGIDSDTVRYRGELLLEEVTRAAAYLSQLAAYSEEQQGAPELVDVTKVLRDLAPVLKRVAGENIDVVLAKPSSPLNLDVEARPVERMLVNVAAYGRERMPLGGKLMIDVDAVVVDREFVAKHPNVRPGDHVLLTVNEQRRPTSNDSQAVSTFSGDSPGVDLGALQALVSECGGHLWMRAEPPGDMELKIHLPRRVLDRSEAPAPPIAPGRSRWLKRAFGARH